jgi:hypothetical protein
MENIIEIKLDNHKPESKGIQCTHCVKALSHPD